MIKLLTILLGMTMMSFAADSLTSYSTGVVRQEVIINQPIKQHQDWTLSFDTDFSGAHNPMGWLIFKDTNALQESTHLDINFDGTINNRDNKFFTISKLKMTDNWVKPTTNEILTYKFVVDKNKMTFYQNGNKIFSCNFNANQDLVLYSINNPYNNISNIIFDKTPIIPLTPIGPSIPVVPNVPEPSSSLLLLAGLTVVMLKRKRQN